MRCVHTLTLFLLIAAMAGSGCSKWLDVNPKSYVSERVLFEDEQGFKDALIGVYVQLASRPLYAKEMTMGLMDVLAVNYDVKLNTSAYYQAGLYNYKDAATQARINAFWTNGYKAISNLNNLLSAIDGSKQLFSGNNYALVKGEALALRALIHFDLLRIFGPDPVTGMDKKAIPYVKVFDMNVKPAVTTQTVISECLADLTAATELLSVRKTVNAGDADIFLAFTRNHLNYWAATGLTARILLYKGDKANAYKKAKEVIDAKLFPFVTSAQLNSASSPDRTFSPEHLFCLYVSNLTDINAELFKSTALTSLLTNKDAFINTRFEIAGGGSTDFRYLYLWKTEGATAVKYPAKFWQDDIGATNMRNRVPIIRLTEMYYIAAETANTKSEKIGWINAVRTNRGLTALPESLSDSDVENELFKEYKKEFYQEGQLFFYYKRLKKAQIEGYALPADDAVYVLPKPDDEIEFNP